MRTIWNLNALITGSSPITKRCAVGGKEKLLSQLSGKLTSDLEPRKERREVVDCEGRSDMATFSSREFGKADFVLLDEVTEEEFMQNLKLRFQKGKIYSYIGKNEVHALSLSFMDVSVY